MNLQTEFGDIDIYVFDQLLRGRIAPGMRVFDAGCGGGRNLVYLLRQGYEVFGNDASADAIAKVRALASSVASGFSRTDVGAHFRHEAIENTSFEDASADVVIASAVLHFARDDAHFAAMLQAMWRVLRPGGLFFARLASTIGMRSRSSAGSSLRGHRPIPRLGCLTARIATWWMPPPSSTGPRGSAGSSWTPSRPRSSTNSGR